MRNWFRNKVALAAAVFGTLLLTPLAACTQLQQGNITSIPGVTTSVCSHTAYDEKAMYALEALYNVPAQAYVTADQRGLINATLKAQLKPKLQQAYTYLKGARAAYEICDTTTLGSYQTALQKFHDEILPLIPIKQ